MVAVVARVLAALLARVGEYATFRGRGQARLVVPLISGVADVAVRGVLHAVAREVIVVFFRVVDGGGECRSG